MVFVKGKDFSFDLKVVKSKSIYAKYRQFLEGIVRQKKSSCEISLYCKERPCLLLIDPSIVQEQVLPYPLIEVYEQEEFLQKVEEIKNVTGLFERF